MLANPTPATELTALAERCEQASGPEYALEVEIARAVGRPIPSGFQQQYDGLRVPNYTASIDAAMTLASTGYHLAFDPHFMDDDNVIRYCGYSFRPDWAKWNPHDMEWLNRDGSDNPLCATAPLALCAAALRALAARASEPTS